MKAKKRAGVRKLIKPEDAERRRKVNAAIRHAEKIVKETGVYEPVVFRSSPGSELSPQAQVSPIPRPKVRRKNEPAVGVPPANPAMKEALHKALNIAQRPFPAPGEHLSVKGLPQPLSAAKAAFPQIQKPAVPAEPIATRSRARFARDSECKATEALPTKLAKKAAKQIAKTAAKKAAKRVQKRPAQPLSKASRRLSELTEKLRTERIKRESAKESNEISRRALNARLSAAKDAERAAGQSPFEKLKRDWSAAFNMLQRYEDEDPNAANIVAARRRLDLIEAEWDRRHALKPGDPDYFPWPSTDIDPSSSNGNAIERHEIGMMSYLGYHVGLNSQLTGSQRARLLGQIFTMRLPPLNGLDYMRDWGAPRTGSRLRKIAENIAYFAKNAKGKNRPALETAITHWEDDLRHLRRQYYDGRFDFQWPR